MNPISVFYQHVRVMSEQEQCSLEEALHFTRQHGISHLDMDEGEIQDSRAFKCMLKQEGMSISSIYFMYDWHEPANSPKNLSRMALIADLQPISVLPIPTLYTAEYLDGQKEELQRAIEVEAGIVEMIQSTGCIPEMEDFDNARSPIATIAGMQAFLQVIPDLKVAFDTGNFRFSAEDVLEAYPIFRGRISHVHLKDRLLLPDVQASLIATHGSPLDAVDGAHMYPCAVGSGSLPIGTMITKLQDDGFEGVYSCEFFSSASMKKNIQASADYVKTALQNT